jgi:hypothetical protein
MNRRSFLAVGLGLLALVSAAPAAPAQGFEHEFRYAPELFTVAEREGLTHVVVAGATREFRAGRPDLPWLGEMVEVPAGFRVAGVRVVVLETAPLKERAMLPSAVEPRPGLEPVERTAPDPEYFSRAGFQPGSPVRLGYQGWMRGRNMASFEVCPVRWDAVSGRLERVTRLSVRIELEPGLESPAPRERIVPEWEDVAPVAPVPGTRLTPESERDPVTGKPRPFRATQIPSVLGSPVAYVIITNDEMAGEFQRLADWKTQSGVPAVVRTLSFIRQEYLSASDDAERIRLFIRDAYSRWGTKWVLLGGDTEVIPTRYAFTLYSGGENIACDMYYSCLDGNWNADGDGVYGEERVSPTNLGDNADLLPEVWVGRAPAISVAEAAQFVNKTFQYTRQSVGDYENSVLFFAEVLFPQNWRPGDFINLDGAQLAEDVLPPLRTIPAIRYARLYENYTNPGWEPGALQESRRAVLDSLSRGYNVSVHIGHGYRNVMSCADANIDNNDVLALTNGTRLTNLYAIACTSNAIDFPCIGEAFLHAANGGAVTNIGSSRYDFPIAGRHFEEEYFHLVYEDSVTAVGEAQGRQKLPFIAGSTGQGMNRWTVLTLLLLGDPELRIYTGTPRILSVSHAASIALSDTAIAVTVTIGGTPLAGARVTAYKPDDEYSTGTTDAAGQVQLPFRADAPGSVTLTVTGYDCKPYQAAISLTGASLPVLADQPVVVDDDSYNGTLGDGNGALDAAETADLLVPLRNNGGSTAPSVAGTLSTTDALITVLMSHVSYGNIAPGTTSSPATRFRVTLPVNTPDQREIPFRLDLTDGMGRHSYEMFQLVASAPELRHFSHQVLDAGGDNDGRPDPGETVTYLVRLRNLGTGGAYQVTAKLRNHDGLATVVDSAAAWGDIAPGEEKQGDALVFVPSDSNARLELRVSDSYGLQFTQVLDLLAPETPAAVVGSAAERSISLVWEPSTAPDLLGYNIYRSLSAAGPFVRVDAVPTDRTSYFLDDSLTPLTAYYYEITAVDSSGNESDHSAAVEFRTTLPNHAIFPIPMGRSTPSSVALDPIYPGYVIDILVGSNVLHLWHADGTAPVDADGAGATSGDFTTRGIYYAAGPSIADLDGDNVKEIIGPNWDPSDTARVFVFDLAGRVRPGWPAAVHDSIWSSAAIGDVDNDGKKEMFFGTFGNEVYGLRYDGSEVRDGDNNPATTGVFKVLGTPYNYGTPAIADLDGDGYLEIIYGSLDRKLYAWRYNGTSLPGFPVTVPGEFTSSAAVGYLDGPGDAELDIAIGTGSYGTSGSTDSLYVFRANGQRKPGWPVAAPGSRSGHATSPALADMNNDGYVDVVYAGTDGILYVRDRNANPVPPVSGVRYSAMTAGASESSPVVADINGDGLNDVVMGDDLGSLTAISGTGAVLPGFPVQLGAEVKGTPGLCDCDGDGMTEIVVACWDRNLYMWDYDFTFSPGQIPPWPQFHHDAMRTGLATNRPFAGVDDPGPAGVPALIEFAPPWPNPARAKTRIWYDVPTERAGAGLELSVYDLSGRRVRVIERGRALPGRHSAEWNLRDQTGTSVGPGVYFLRLSLGLETRAKKLVVMR